MDTRSFWVLGYWADQREPHIEQWPGFLLSGGAHAAEHRILIDLNSLPRLLSERLVSPLDLGTEIVRYLAPGSGGRWDEREAISTTSAYTQQTRPELLSEWDVPSSRVSAVVSDDDLPF